MMMKHFLSLVRNGWMLLTVLSLGLFIACSDDDDPEPAADPVASFQIAISETNFLEVTFTNFSQNAVSYSWDFGDGNSSTDESPTHTYAAAGTYTVVLTATNADGVAATREESVNLVNPNAFLEQIAGTESKVWILQREGVALGIGPAPGANDWWSFGGVTPLAERPCILDDEITFSADGTFQNDTKGTLFRDTEGNGGWNDDLGTGESCEDESAAVLVSSSGVDYSSLANGGSYTWELNETNDVLTISGQGAYIGLPNKTNTGDLGPDNAPAQSIVYEITNIVDTDDVDSLTLTISVNNGEQYWNFNLVSYGGATAMPDVPSGVEPPPPFGEDLDDISPTELSRTFAGSEAAEFVLLDTIASGSGITYGVDNPDGSGTKVGQFERIAGVQFQELQLQTSPTKNDINFENLTTVTMDVYLPSSNDYTGTLTKGVIIGLADKSATEQWWTDHYEYSDDGSTLAEDTWVTLTYQLDAHNAGAGAGTVKERNDLDMVYISIGGGGHDAGGTFYIRNLKFE